MADNKFVLIVEDNESIAKLVKYKLEKDGYRTQVADNGIDGLEAAQNTNADLVILDVMMPGMNGFEILQKLRENEATKNQKVMMLTSKSREEDIQRGFDLGVLEYMSKPFKVAELAMRVKKVLEN